MANKEKSVADLVSVLAEKTGLSKAQTKSFLDSYAEVLADELNSAGSVQIVGVGKLKVGSRAERQGRNPATGEAITIPAARNSSFQRVSNSRKGSVKNYSVLINSRRRSIYGSLIFPFYKIIVP